MIVTSVDPAVYYSNILKIVCTPELFPFFQKKNLFPFAFFITSFMPAYSIFWA
jgi:hypothetical protein